MKKYILTILSLVFIGSGCVTANQKELELKYYETQQALIESKQQQESRPLFEIVSKDNDKPMVFENVSSIRVFQPDMKSDTPLVLRQYKQTDYMAPWIGLLNRGLSIGIPAYAAYKTIDSVASHAGNTYTSSGEGNFTVGDTTNTNSGDGSFNMTGDSETYTDSYNEGSYNDSVRDSYDSGMWDSTIEDNTHVPTIVEQPDYNEPIIIEQPEPIIINQNE